jgi:hypothetical protein
LAEHRSVRTLRREPAHSAVITPAPRSGKADRIVDVPFRKRDRPTLAPSCEAAAASPATAFGPGGACPETWTSGKAPASRHSRTSWLHATAVASCPGGNHPNRSQRAVTPKGTSVTSHSLHSPSFRLSRTHPRLLRVRGYVREDPDARLTDAGPAFLNSTVRVRSGSRLVDLRNWSPRLHPSGVPSGLVGLSASAIATTLSPPYVGVSGTGEDVR